MDGSMSKGRVFGSDGKSRAKVPHLYIITYEQLVNPFPSSSSASSSQFSQREGEMVQRLTYRKRHSYATKSNQHRVVKTPGGRLVYQTTKKRASGPKCPVTGKRIQGIPHLRPAEYKRSRLPRNRRTVNRAYGGVLSGSAVRERKSKLQGVKWVPCPCNSGMVNFGGTTKKAKS